MVTRVLDFVRANVQQPESRCPKYGPNSRVLAAISISTSGRARRSHSGSFYWMKKSHLWLTHFLWPLVAFSLCMSAELLATERACLFPMSILLPISDLLHFSNSGTAYYALMFGSNFHASHSKFAAIVSAAYVGYLAKSFAAWQSTQPLDASLSKSLSSLVLQHSSF